MQFPLFTDEGVSTAHKHAWKKHEILHCDISAGNILILDTANDGAVVRSVGLLCDWDLAKRRVHIAHPEISQPTRLVRHDMLFAVHFVA